MSMNVFWDLQNVPREAPALIVPGHPAVSYGMLATLAEDWKKQLLEMAAGRRPIVALEFSTRVEAVAAYLGALQAELPVLALEPGQLATSSALQHRWQPEIRIAEHLGTLVASENAAPAVAADPHPDLRLLLSTSGSTGDPKLVRLSARNIDSNARSIAEYLAITVTDRAMTTLPMFYSYGLSVLNSYLASGAALILTERSVVDPAFWREFSHHDATSLALVPHQFDLLDRNGFSERDLPKLRYITQAGGKLPTETVRRFHAMGIKAGWDLVLMYGQTEAAPRISYVPPEALPGAADTIGRAIPGGHLRLEDEAGVEITRPGIPGELIYEGPNVMMGYAETREDLARNPEVDQLRTGDIAELTNAGLFRIVGRLKRFVKLFGLRLSLDQIEAFLCDSGIPAHAVTVDDNLVILHEKNGQGTAAREAVAAKYELPLAVIHTGYLKEPPLLTSGKTDHKTLRLIASEVLAEAGNQKQAQKGETIAEALRAATRSPAVTPKDSFATLGGDSLSYLQMQMALEHRLGHAPNGWETMSLEQLEALDPISPSSAQRTPIGIDVVLRLLAICLVVGQHATDYPLYGGVWMLIAIMGYSAARFQFHLIIEGKALRLAWRMLYPIVPLYFMLLLAYGMFRKEVPNSSILLYGNYELWPKGSLLTVYWFVSLYVQIVAILMLTSLIGPIRRELGRSPWRMAMLAMLPLLALTSALTLLPGMIDKDNIAIFPLLHYPTRGLVECLPIFVIGWMIQKAKGNLQTAITCILAITTLLIFTKISDGTAPALFLTLTVILLAINPTVEIPIGWSRKIQQLAGVTLFVYLLHEVVIYSLDGLKMPQPIRMIFAIILSFIAALASKKIFECVDRGATRLVTGVLGRRSLRSDSRFSGMR
ncbi:AMP-binding protein [Tabrizicola sp. J26]|uniref:AMP-binding protein n=1 Tax=Alitabrizicola rongguiensis TaxID=2909234 RepID=UPI001F2583D1|nr:AMP-binding protein [Tabrizicola rongguiensis]MCF1711074.1 AMP-binding protein [Tabrizicola rongguiensis]